MSTLLEQAQAAAEKLQDQTVDNGGFDFEPTAEGPCVGRLVSYVELGKQPQKPYMGKPKPPCLEVVVEFELLGKKHAREIEYTNEEGKLVKKTVYPIHREKLAVKTGSKASFHKLFKAMLAGRDGITNMAFLLGEAFLIHIVHNTVTKDGKDIVYANMKTDDGVWKIGAPVVQKFTDMGEPDGPPTPLKAPPATVKDRMLLWGAPSIEQWNSIHIPGTYTKKDDKGNETEVSKNWLQRMCTEAVDWDGSGIQSIVSELAGDLPDVDVDPDIDLDGVEDAEVLDDTGLDDLSGDEGTPETEDGSDDAPDTSGDPLADLGL